MLKPQQILNVAATFLDYSGSWRISDFLLSKHTSSKDEQTLICEEYYKENESLYSCTHDVDYGHRNVKCPDIASAVQKQPELLKADHMISAQLL